MTEEQLEREGEKTKERDRLQQQQKNKKEGGKTNVIFSINSFLKKKLLYFPLILYLNLNFAKNC